MEFAFDAKTEELRDRLAAFMADQVEPAKETFPAQLADLDAAGERWAWSRTPIMQEL